MFHLSENCKQTYPGAQAGILALSGVANPAQHAELDEHKAALENQLRDLFTGLDRSHIAALPPIRTYQAYYKRFDKTYHVQLQLESIALKGKPFPRAAALVEAMFMAEVKNLLLTAGHNYDTLQLPVTMEVARGDESYTLLRGQPQTLKSGDLYMRDGAGVISSILYGPDQRTQITPATRNVLFAVYAPEGIEAEVVLAHLWDLQTYVRLIAPEARTEMLQVFSAE
jgi:DNA/RNA-binding domain of Phe-tRNA-synthetase-like protein